MFFLLFWFNSRWAVCRHNSAAGFRLLLQLSWNYGCLWFWNHTLTRTTAAAPAYCWHSQHLNIYNRDIMYTSNRLTDIFLSEPTPTSSPARWWLQSCKWKNLGISTLCASVSFPILLSTLNKTEHGQTLLSSDKQQVWYIFYFYCIWTWLMW